MSRKRQPYNDWICRRCLCPCTPAALDGSQPPFGKHLGGGQGMRACKHPTGPLPVLRSVHEAEMSALADAARNAIRRTEGH